MNEEGSDNVICCAYEAFSFPILRRSVRAREPKNDAVTRKIASKGVSKEFTTIVTLQTFYGYMELSAHILKEIL
jgi:hypothetical protein